MTPFDTDDLDAFIALAIDQSIVESSCRVQDISDAHKKRGVVAVLEWVTNIEGRTVTLQVGFQDSFPLTVPILFLSPPDGLGLIPHVETDGYICYVEGEGLLVDRRNPFGILEEALQRARRTLTKGVRGENRADFVDEFEAYWRRCKDVQLIRSFVVPNGEVRKIFVAEADPESRRKVNAAYALVADGEQALRDYWNRRGAKARTHRTALYVPLEEGTDLLPPSPDEFWNLDDVRRIVDEHTSSNTKRVLAKLVRKPKREEVILFGLPRPRGGRALFAVRFVGVDGGYPLFEGSSVRKLEPLAFERYDREYLLPRGGASESLAGKRVAVIGCGSVGGFISLELARAGISYLTLVDHEQIAPENSFRHVLGRESQGAYKARALKVEIERKLPYVEVQAITKRFESAFNDKTVAPQDYDLVVVALGTPAFSLYINETLRSLSNAPPAVYTWVEAYGIGGHALLNSLPGTPGCLECLFTRPSGEELEPLSNRASFAAPGQSFAKDLSGCGSLFIPYGSLDALRTAELATRLALQALTESLSGNPILSWKGPSDAFVSAGFQLSDRYDLTERELFEQRNDYHHSNCPVCGVS